MPVGAPGGTVKVTLPSLTLVGTVRMLPSMTPTVPPRFVPVMVTLMPTDTIPGLMLVIVGGGSTLKLPELVKLPPGVVTWIVPLVAPAGTVKVSFVADAAKGQLVPLSCTWVVSARFVPVSVTVAWVPPVSGVNVVMVGGATNVNVPLLVPVPIGVVTATVPVEPDPTTAVTWLSESTVKLAAAVPPNVTAVAPVRFDR